MAKGKWAQGIKPRSFQWVIEDQLAVCVRPGGIGTNHRRVRRQEEVIWLRENRFSAVVSLLPSNHNLHSYDELGLPWYHWPFPPSIDYETYLPMYYGELHKLLNDNKRLIMHIEDVGDRLGGFIGGYLRWNQMVDITFEAITVTERLLGRQLGPEGREIVTSAGEVADKLREERAQKVIDLTSGESDPSGYPVMAPDSDFIPASRSGPWIG